jgi:hypothetical protein
MLIRRGEDPDKMDDAQMTLLFEKHLTQVDEWLRAQPNFRVLYVHYSDVLTDPQPQITAINRFLGGNLNVTAMGQMVDPQLYRNRKE